jgi:beta-glucosidase
VQVKNTGGLDGDETAEVYLVPKGRSKRPIQKLVSFKKVHLRKGETKTLQMTIDPRQLSMVEQDGSRSVEAGEYEIYVGGSQPQKDAGIFLTFTIEGSLIVAP